MQLLKGVHITCSYYVDIFVSLVINNRTCAFDSGLILLE